MLISPVFGQVPLPEAAAWIVDSGLPLRLNPQLHKYIWGPEVQGSMRRVSVFGFRFSVKA